MLPREDARRLARKGGKTQMPRVSCRQGGGAGFGAGSRCLPAAGVASRGGGVRREDGRASGCRGVGWGGVGWGGVGQLAPSLLGLAGAGAVAALQSVIYHASLSHTLAPRLAWLAAVQCCTSTAQLAVQVSELGAGRRRSCWGEGSRRPRGRLGVRLPHIAAQRPNCSSPTCPPSWLAGWHASLRLQLRRLPAAEVWQASRYIIAHAPRITCLLCRRPHAHAHALAVPLPLPPPGARVGPGHSVGPSQAPRFRRAGCSG